MNCPLVLNFTGTLGTVDYLAPCECLTLCILTSCKYRKCGFLVQVNSKGGTETNTVSILAPRCGGNLVLVAASTGALVTESELTAGTVYTVYPSTVNGILRGIVQGI